MQKLHKLKCQNPNVKAQMTNEVPLPQLPSRQGTENDQMRFFVPIDRDSE
jgi:hypothetical protein